MTKGSIFTFEGLFPREMLLKMAEHWYKERGVWPLRRYRLESEEHGNSRLLSMYFASKAQYRFGGKIVEVIPTREHFIRGIGLD